MSCSTAHESGFLLSVHPFPFIRTMSLHYPHSLLHNSPYIPMLLKSRASECVCFRHSSPSLSHTHAETEVCVPIGVQVIHPACPYLWCNSTLIHSVANALALTKLHDHIRTATTFSVSIANTHKHFPCGLKCRWSGKCWMKPMLWANHIRAYVLRHAQTQAQQAHPQCC